jgi:hypothetical protein
MDELPVNIYRQRALITRKEGAEQTLPSSLAVGPHKMEKKMAGWVRQSDLVTPPKSRKSIGWLEWRKSLSGRNVEKMEKEKSFTALTLRPTRQDQMPRKSRFESFILRASTVSIYNWPPLEMEIKGDAIKVHLFAGSCGSRPFDFVENWPRALAKQTRASIFPCFPSTGGRQAVEPEARTQRARHATWPGDH